jgi:uncharacterized protein YdhG (YjbR/CyaY superfamily)
MQSKKTGPTTIDQYIEGFPKEIRIILSELRSAIRTAAPQASEKISYQIPTFYFNGNLVHFAAYKTHIGFYPTSSGIAAFQKELAKYKTAKGTVQFPIDKPLPLDLIKRMVKFRVMENSQKKENDKIENDPIK